VNLEYRVRIVPGAERDLSRLVPRVRRRIEEALRALARDPRPRGALKLVDSLMWRLRVGDYRVLYTIRDEERLVRVLALGHRREAYR